METQKVLIEALFQLISEKEYEKISIRDITQRAHVDRTTFYLHFKDKEDMFLKGQEEMIKELFLSESGNDQPYPRATQIFEMMAKHPEASRVLINLDGNSLMAKRFHVYLLQYLKPLIEEKLPAGNSKITDQEMELLVNYIGGAMRGTARWWLQAGRPYTPAEMGQRFMRLTLLGIQAASSEWK